MIDHLIQPDKQISIPYTKEISRSCGNGEQMKLIHENMYTFGMAPVIFDGRETWRSIPIENLLDEEVTELMLFEAWCKKHEHESKTVNEWGAIHIFREDLPFLCNDHIRAGEDVEYWRDLLNKLRNQNNLKFKEQIKRAKEVSIEDLINRAGYEIRMNFIKCPFHDDGSASLKIYPETNTWWCFGCQSGSSTIDFIMKTNQCDLKQAIDYLI